MRVNAVAVLVTRNPLKPALGTLLSILAGIGTAFIAAEARATAGVHLHLPWLSIQFDYVVLNPNRPEWLWLFMFFGTGAMMLYIATLLHKERLRSEEITHAIAGGQPSHNF